MFTDKQLRALKPKSSPYRVSEGGSDRGFGIQISTAGTKTFFLQYRESGKVKYLALGQYPSLSIAEAREKAKQARLLRDRGANPKTGLAPGESKCGTCKQLFDYYVDQMRLKEKKSWAQVAKRLERDVVPAIGNMQAKDVTPEHIKRVLFDVIQRDAEVYANRLRSYMHTAFKQGIYHDNDPKQVNTGLRFNIVGNPVSVIPVDTAAENVGERVLTNSEIINLFSYSGSAISKQSLNALRLIFASGGQRPMEITGLLMSEISFEDMTLSFPPKRVKNNKYHLLPITDLMLSIIQNQMAVNGDNKVCLFPKRGKETEPQDKDTLIKAVTRLCLREPGLFDYFSPRDLRRTAKTFMGRLGVSKEIRDRIQNHARTDVSSKHYDRYDYLSEKLGGLNALSRSILYKN